MISTITFDKVKEILKAINGLPFRENTSTLIRPTKAVRMAGDALKLIRKDEEGEA